MKKLLLFTLVCFASVLSFGQKTANASTESLQKGKTSGTFVFVMPSDVTAAEVDGVKNYYKQYFSATMDEKKHELVVTLINKDDETSKRVINRLMVSLEVSSFSVGGTELSFDEMFDKYMK